MNDEFSRIPGIMILQHRTVLNLFCFLFKIVYSRTFPSYLTDNVHNWDRSWDSFVCEKGSHGDHGSSSILHLNIFVTGHLFWGSLLLNTKVIKVQVTWGLSGLSSPVVTRMADTLTFGNCDKSKNGKEKARLFGSENSKSVFPVSLWESIKVQSQSKSTLSVRESQH